MEYARFQKRSVFGAPHVFFLKHLTKKKRFHAFLLALAICTPCFPGRVQTGAKLFAHTAAHPQRPNAGQTEQETEMQAFLPPSHKHHDAKLLLCRVASETSMDRQPCGIPWMLAEKQGAAIFIFQQDIGFSPVHYVPHTVVLYRLSCLCCSPLRLNCGKSNEKRTYVVLRER